MASSCNHPRPATSSDEPRGSAEARKRDARREDRRRLEDGESPAVLQAENSAVSLVSLSGARIAGVTKFAPFTSKDCDLWVGLDIFKQFQQVLPGQIDQGTRPVAGSTRHPP